MRGLGKEEKEEEVEEEEEVGDWGLLEAGACVELRCLGVGLMGSDVGSVGLPLELMTLFSKLLAVS